MPVVHNYYRLLLTSDTDRYCRYLPIGLVLGDGNKFCGGRFFTYMRDKFKIEKIPYNITVRELISEGALKPALFVELPEEAFESWKNFPTCPSSLIEGMSEQAQLAHFYNIHIFTKSTDLLEDISHPYDSELKSAFADNFRVPPPIVMTPLVHSNGRKYYPYEAYLPYWKGYVLFDAYVTYPFISKYLDSKKGKPLFMQAVLKADQEWTQLYADSFNRISWFRTVITNIIYTTDSEIKLSYYDLVRYVFEKTNSSTDDLNHDLELLLRLHWKWERQLERTGLRIIKNTLQSVEYDIYTVYSMLCVCGVKSDELFDKWSITDRMPRGWTELSKTIPFEDLKFQDIFGSTLGVYLEEVANKGDALSLYTRLAEYEGFECWIRAYCDLHTELQSSQRISFRQSRQIDRLIVFCLRTEVLLKAMVKSYLNISCDSLMDALDTVKNDTSDSNLKNAIDTAKAHTHMTKLHRTPVGILDEIEKRSEEFSSWPEKRRALFRYILFCNVGRNYFAHHSYLDNEFEDRQSKNAAKILKACLAIINICEESMRKARS